MSDPRLTAAQLNEYLAGFLALRDAGIEIDDAGQEMESMVRELIALRADVERLTTERDALQEAVHTSDHDLDLAMNTTRTVLKERDALREEHEKDLEFLMVKREAAEGSVERLERELAEARAEIDRLDCTRREGGDMLHCRVDNLCRRCESKADGIEIGRAQAMAWQPIETHDGSSKAALLRIPLDNGSNPRMATILGFFAKAGTTPMDDAGEDWEECVNEEGCNLEDAWFSESDDREPYAMMLNYPPTHWMPLPAPPAETKEPPFVFQSIHQEDCAMHPRQHPTVDDRCTCGAVPSRAEARR